MEIIVKSATKYIKKALILDDVNIQLTGGKIYGLKGPNGSGKTMLMRLLSGLLRPTSGEVWIDGKKLGKDMDFPESVGLLIENPAFLPNYTGYKNLELLAQIRGKIGAEQICQSLLEVGLDPHDPRRYRKYSLGMKQRLGIAAAIMEKPDLLIVDEPTNALDDSGVEQICTILRRERERGALVVIACHDSLLLQTLSDEIYKIYEGKVTK